KLPEPPARNTIRTSIRSLRMAGDLVRSMQTPSDPRSADQIDQEHGREHRQDEPTGTLEDEEPHEEADEGPGETQQDRHADAEGIRPREQHPCHRPNDEAQHEQAEDADDHAVSVGWVRWGSSRAVVAEARRDRFPAAQAPWASPAPAAGLRAWWRTAP